METETIVPAGGSPRHREPSEMIAAGHPASAGTLTDVPVRAAEPTSAALRVAYWLSGAVAALMIAASVAGLAIDGVYREGDWAREALRGGDLVTLMLAAPILILALTLSIRGSHRAEPVWIGMLIYAVYNYAFYAFGTTFNDLLLLHIALLSMSVFALACAVPNLDRAAIAATFREAIAARWVGLALAVVGVAQGGLWLFVVGRNAVTGELLADVPVAAQHLVFTLDLALLVPALVVGGIMLFLRKPFGYLLG
ncbi:MAG: hypothetical protein ACXWW5_04645, partial [Actinomycetota bacterium]